MTIEQSQITSAAERYTAHHATVGTNHLADPLQTYRLHALPSPSDQSLASPIANGHLANLSIGLTGGDGSWRGGGALSDPAWQRLQNVCPVGKYEHPHIANHLHANQTRSLHWHTQTATAAYAKPFHEGRRPTPETIQHAPALSTLSQHLARSAATVASEIGTVGNCALGPRRTFDKVGFHLPPVVATEQGRIIEQSGLFHQVPRSQVRPGDYAYRHWTDQVIKQHGGVDKGDSFIVAQVGSRGQLYGANDHTFVVPEDGDRYTDTKFFRPNEDFLRQVKFA